MNRFTAHPCLRQKFKCKCLRRSLKARTLRAWRVPHIWWLLPREPAQFWWQLRGLRFWLLRERSFQKPDASLSSKDYFLFSLIASRALLLYFGIILKTKQKKPQQHEKLLAWFCLPINYPLVEEVGPVVFYHCGRVQFHGSKPHHFIATVLMTHQGKACII